MHLLIAGGGTGGHIYPALAVVEALRRRPNPPDINWLGGQRGLEERIVPAAGVPLHIRNAPTALMKELGYNDGYQYAHAVPEAYIPQEYLPEALAGSAFYQPGSFGFEKEIAKRLAWWQDLRDRAKDPPAPARGRKPSTEE